MIVIRPVQDPGKILFAPLDISRKPVRSGLAQDLLGVGGTDRRDGIGEKNGAFHKVDAPEILEFRIRKIVPPETQEPVGVGFEGPLVGDIVDRENARGSGEKGIALLPDLEIGRDERGLPIMAMDDVRLEFQILAKLEAGTGKKTEALGVVRELPVAVIIKSGAAEITFMFNEIDRESVRCSLENLAPDNAVPRRNTHRPQDRLEPVLFLADGPVARQNQADVMTEFFQDLGQRAAHVAEAAGLDERHRLRSCEKDLIFFSVFSALSIFLYHRGTIISQTISTASKIFINL